MADWKLVDKQGSFYVEGLKPDYLDSDDTLLMVIYDAGDCDTVSEPGERMHRALYDTYQTSGIIKDGDTFSLDGAVLYKAEGVHVVQVEPKPADTPPAATPRKVAPTP